MNIIKILSRCVATTAVAGAVTIPLTHASDARAQREADTSAEVVGPNILVNGGFEQGADPAKVLHLAAGVSPLLAGWTVVIPGGDPRNIAYIGTYWQAEEGTRSLGLGFGLQPPTTDTAKLNGVKQTVTTIAGQRYRVTFYQAGGPDWGKTPQMLRIVLAGQAHDYTFQADTQANDQHMQWVKRTFVFTASGPSTTIGLYMLYGVGLEGLDNVQMRAIQTASTGQTPVAGAPVAMTAQLAAPTLAAGGRQTVSGTTGKSAAVAVVIDYPDGSQQLVPAHADAAGHYTYAWTVPTTVHGMVKVIVVDDAGTVARSSFTVS